MATWTAATAIPAGNLITSAWMSTTTAAINFLGASSSTAGKDLFFARQGSGQVIAAATYTALTFGGEDIDVANGHSTSTNTGRYTAQAAGKYRLVGSIAIPNFGASGAAIIGAYYKNGAVIATDAKAAFVNPAAQATLVMPTYYVSLAATDYVELRVFNATGFTTDVSGQQSTFGVEWVGA